MYYCPKCGREVQKFVIHNCPNKRFEERNNMYCTDCGRQQHTDECRQNRPSRNPFGRPLSDMSLSSEQGSRTWMQANADRLAIWAVYTKADNIAALVSIHCRADDAIRHAAGDGKYQVCQLPFGVEFQDAVTMWEKSWRKSSQAEEKRAELRSYLEDQGYSQEKIDELVYASDDDKGE